MDLTSLGVPFSLSRMLPRGAHHGVREAPPDGDNAESVHPAHPAAGGLGRLLHGGQRQLQHGGGRGTYKSIRCKFRAVQVYKCWCTDDLYWNLSSSMFERDLR